MMKLSGEDHGREGRPQHGWATTEARLCLPFWQIVAFAVLFSVSQARAQSITVAIDRSSVTPVTANLSGANVSSSDSPESFADPAVQALVRPLQPTMLRWPGGTVSDFFDWSTGLIPLPGAGSAAGAGDGVPTPIDIERFIFQPYPTLSFNKQIQKAADKHQPILLAKGGNPLGDTTSGFAGFATAVGAKFLVVVNATTNTIEAAERLAFTVARRRLPVVGFELVNEPFFIMVPTSAGTFTLPLGAPKVLGAYTDGVDYLTKMKPYYEAIKRGYASAGVSPLRAIVAIAGGYAADVSGWNAQWGQDLAAYTFNHGAYWDAVAMHFYPPETKQGGFAKAMTYANDALSIGTNAFVHDYRAANWSRGKPLFVSEYGVTMNDKTMNGSVYAGIFCAEYVARMSVFPETAALLLHELFNDSVGIAAPRDAIGGNGDWKKDLISAGQAGRMVDTVGRLKGSFYNAEILGLGLANAALNASDRAYATKLSGPLGTVAARMSALPAVYAQAYHGRDGSTHLIVTNKGSDSKLVAVVIDGQRTLATFSMDMIHPTAGDPSERNSASEQPITVQHATVKDAIEIPGYSVAHLRLNAG